MLEIELVGFTAKSDPWYKGFQAVYVTRKFL